MVMKVVTTQILIPDLRKILPFYGLSGMTTSKVV